MHQENETLMGDRWDTEAVMFENPLLQRKSNGRYEAFVHEEEDEDCESGFFFGWSGSGSRDLEGLCDVDNNLSKHRQRELRMKRICRALVVLLTLVGAAGVAALACSRRAVTRGGSGAGAEPAKEEAREVVGSGDVGDDVGAAAEVALGGRCSACCFWGGALSGTAAVVGGAAGVWWAKNEEADRLRRLNDESDRQKAEEEAANEAAAAAQKAAEAAKKAAAVAQKAAEAANEAVADAQKAVEKAKGEAAAAAQKAKEEAAEKAAAAKQKAEREAAKKAAAVARKAERKNIKAPFFLFPSRKKAMRQAEREARERGTQ